MACVPREASCGDCSGHGACALVNTSGAVCLCDEGWTSSTTFWKYPAACRTSMALHRVMASVSMVVGLVAMCTSLAMLASNVFRAPAATGQVPRQRKAAAAAGKRRKNSRLIYTRIVVTSLVGTAYEALSLLHGPLDLFDKPSGILVLRCAFGWLVMGQVLDITDTVARILPLKFVKAGSRSSFDVVRNRLISFLHGNVRRIDLLLLLQFSWIVVLPLSSDAGRDLCGCWCMAVLQLTIGCSCLLPLLHLNLGTEALVDMLLKVKSGDSQASQGALAVTCGRLATAAGCRGFVRLWGSKFKSSAPPRTVFRLRIMHAAGFIIGWGAFIFCLLIGLEPAVQHYNGVFDTCTFIFAHCWHCSIVWAICGDDSKYCRCERAEPDKTLAMGKSTSYNTSKVDPDSTNHETTSDTYTM